MRVSRCERLGTRSAYLVADAVHRLLSVANLHLLRGHLRLLLGDLARQLAVLGAEAFEGGLNGGQLLAELVVLLLQDVLVLLNLALKGLQV